MLAVAGAIAALAAAACSRPTPTPASEHIRGTVERFDGRTLTVANAAGRVNIDINPSVAVGVLTRADRARLLDGSFVGITSITEPDGSQRAVEVHLFPDSMRGTGEGSYAWDLPGEPAGDTKMTNGGITSSKMTNGTVSVSRMTNGTVVDDSGQLSLTISFRDGSERRSQTIAIPPDIPIVAIEKGQPSDLQPGTRVVVVAHRSGNELIADRVLAGQGDVVPPM